MYTYNNLGAILCALQCLIILSPSLISRGFLVAAQDVASTLVADEIADFNQTVKVLGDMQRTDQDFKDGLALDLFSPRNRMLVVTKNTSPLPPQFVKDTSGEPFIALSNYSWIIKMNETAKDLIAKIELPYDPVKVKNMGVDVANTYVGKLAPDRMSWEVSELQRNVHVSENNTRIIKLTSLDGEYILLGRKTVDTANIFVQYGFGATRTVNLTGGKGVQEAQFVDGLRISVVAEKPMGVNIDLKSGVQKVGMPTGMRSLNSYAWVMNTSTPNQVLKNGTISLPVNTNLIPSGTKLDTLKFTVGKRPLNSTASSAFEALKETSQVKTRAIRGSDPAIRVTGMTQLDGQYVVLISSAGRKEKEFDSPKKDSVADAKSGAHSYPSRIRECLGFIVVLILGMALW